MTWKHMAALLVQEFHLVVQGCLPRIRGQYRMISNGWRHDEGEMIHDKWQRHSTEDCLRGNGNGQMTCQSDLGEWQWTNWQWHLTSGSASYFTVSVWGRLQNRPFQPQFTLKEQGCCNRGIMEVRVQPCRVDRQLWVAGCHRAQHQFMSGMLSQNKF